MYYLIITICNFIIDNICVLLLMGMVKQYFDFFLCNDNINEALKVELNYVWHFLSST